VCGRQNFSVGKSLVQLWRCPQMSLKNAPEKVEQLLKGEVNVVKQ
jgi:hypothetical protein